MNAITSLPHAEPSALPIEVDGDEAPVGYPLHARVESLWTWQIGLFVLAATLPGLVIAGWRGGWLWFGLVLLVALLAFRLLRHYMRAWRRRFHCELLPDGLRIVRGVWWRNETFVPRPRIQHTEVNQGPIARRYGIAQLKVYTAGTHMADLGVSGLPRESALELRDRLLGRHGHDAV